MTDHEVIARQENDLRRLKRFSTEVLVPIGAALLVFLGVAFR